MQKVGLLLQLSGQVLDVLLFLLQIDIHLLGLSAEACVLITRNVILDLEVAVHIANFLLLSWAEDWGLVCLQEVSLLGKVASRRCLVAIVDSSTCTLDWLGHGHLRIAREKNVSRAVVMNDLLIDTAALLSA